MRKDTASTWRSGLAINLISNVVSLIVGGSVTYFSHEGSAWVKPLLGGGAAWLITFCSILVFRIMKNMPPRSEPVTVDNVERKIRDWLDMFSLTVKTIHDDESHFFFIVTTDGGKKISVSRHAKQFSDYLLIKGLISPSEEENKMLDSMTQDELTAARLAIRLELSRAVMGYKTEDILHDLTIFKRIPITATLKEEDLFNVIWEVEAMLTSIFMVGAMALHRHNVNKAAKENA